jgi:hypothetical protein
MEFFQMAAVLVILTWTWYRFTQCCACCGTKIQHHDYMGNGKIRYRLKGTQRPVCRACGNNNPDMVD